MTRFLASRDFHRPALCKNIPLDAGLGSKEVCPRRSENHAPRRRLCAGHLCAPSLSPKLSCRFMLRTSSHGLWRGHLRRPAHDQQRLDCPKAGHTGSRPKELTDGHRHGSYLSRIPKAADQSGFLDGLSVPATMKSRGVLRLGTRELTFPCGAFHGKDIGAVGPPSALPSRNCSCTQSGLPVAGRCDFRQTGNPPVHHPPGNTCSPKCGGSATRETDTLILHRFILVLRAVCSPNRRAGGGRCGALLDAGGPVYRRRRAPFASPIRAFVRAMRRPITDWDDFRQLVHQAWCMKLSTSGAGIPRCHFLRWQMVSRHPVRMDHRRHREDVEIKRNVAPTVIGYGRRYGALVHAVDSAARAR